MSFVSCFVMEKSTIKGFLCERKAFFNYIEHSVRIKAIENLCMV